MTGNQVVPPSWNDHAPAKNFGLANVWIDRQRLWEGGSWGATAKLESRPETDFQKPGFVDRLIHAQYGNIRAALVTFEKASAKLDSTILLRA